MTDDDRLSELLELMDDALLDSEMVVELDYEDVRVLLAHLEALEEIDYSADKPETIAVTECEGGHWKDFSSAEYRQVHAIKFMDGSIWDAVNGWRNG